ncbi:MAG: hypothetical protein ACR2PM_00465 [Hyphomicrobiales bacterium]
MTHYAEPSLGEVPADDVELDEPGHRTGAALKRTVFAVAAVVLGLVAPVTMMVGYGADPLYWSRANAGVATRVFPVNFAGQAFVISGENVRRIERDDTGAVVQIELAMSWPQPGLALLASTDGAVGPLSLREAIFITLKRRANVMAAGARLNGIYPYYFEAGPADADHGLKVYRFRPTSPYGGQELFVGALNDAWITMRCEVGDSDMMPAMCRREMTAWDGVTVAYRFHRSHLGKWKALDEAVRMFLAEVGQEQ